MVVEPGTQIGRYEIQRKLGGGGMGTVYVAHDPVLGRMVAIKMFRADSDLPDAGHRFSREARSAALLNHPNIVTVYDFGEIDEQPYIVMEYVAGEALSQLIQRKAVVTLGDKLRWMEELCAGAAYAHRMSVVHRDIKPANLMVDKSGRLKILDFGIARMSGTASTTAAMIGTPGYMAPEQFRGEALDQRADVFAIGTVFYELLSFVEAFPGDSLATVMHRVLMVDPAPLHQLLVDCHPDIAAVCERALMKDRDQRFASADDMRESISRVRGELDADAGLTIFPMPRAATPTADLPARDHSGAAPARGADGAPTPTPPGGPRRTDREALARRRQELLEGALQEARAELQRGHVEQALAACQRALAIDETHREALELEERIQNALAAPARTVAHAPIDDDAPTVGPYVPPPASAPNNPPDDRTVLRIPQSPDNDRTVLVRPRATPPPAPAPVATPAPVPAAPAQRPSAPASPPARPASVKSGVADRQRPPLRAWLDAADALRRARQRPLLIGGALLALGAIAVIAMMTRGPAPTGVLVIDAVPWARITAIETTAGNPMPLPVAASTPLSLSLPAGTYRVTLARPGQTTTQVEGTVDAGGVSVLQAAPFETISVEQYFERYLGTPDAAGAGGLP